MAGGAQLLDQLGGEAILQLETGADVAPGAPQQPARRGDGGLQVAAQAIAAEQRGLGLRLAFAAHGAVAQHPAVVEQCQCRVESVERLAPRLQGLQRGRVEGEADAAVLPGNAAGRQHHAGAELPVHTLDKAHRAAFAVDAAHPDGVAGRGRARPLQGALRVDRRRQSIEVFRGEEALRVGRHAARVGDHTITDHECLFGRLDQAMHMGEAFGLGDLEALEHAEDQ